MKTEVSGLTTYLPIKGPGTEMATPPPATFALIGAPDDVSLNPSLKNKNRRTQPAVL
jgi:hypothetical protein